MEATQLSDAEVLALISRESPLCVPLNGAEPFVSFNDKGPFPVSVSVDQVGRLLPALRMAPGLFKVGSPCNFYVPADVKPQPLTRPELPPVPPDQPAIFIEGGPHDFVESEFAQGSGRCDKCGGGPDAPIHNLKDPQERIAAAFERLADVAERINRFAAHDSKCIADALERIADAAEYPRRCGAFWRFIDWCAMFFKGYPAK